MSIISKNSLCSVFTAIFTVVSLSACDNGIVGTGLDKVKGIAQKGPFLLGADVVIHERSAPDFSESATIHTKIVNGLGVFDFDFKPDTFYQIEVSGNFYDETLGAPSNEVVSLVSAYYHKDAKKSPVSINLLTHIIHKRIEFFIANGDAPETAIAKANDELKRQLETTLLPEHMDQLNLNQLTLFNINENANDKGNAVLLFTSASFMKASKMYPTSPSLQQLVDGLANEMEASGVIDNNDISILDIAAKSLNADQIEKNLTEYSRQTTGYEISVPDIRWLLDNDGDGITNDIDLDDDGDTLPDLLDPHPYDFEIIPKNQTFSVSKNTSTELSLSYPDTRFVCTWQIVSDPQHGNLIDLSYQPNLDFTGVDQFQFVVKCILNTTAEYTSPPFIVDLNII